MRCAALGEVEDLLLHVGLARIQRAGRAKTLGYLQPFFVMSDRDDGLRSYDLRCRENGAESYCTVTHNDDRRAGSCFRSDDAEMTGSHNVAERYAYIELIGVVCDCFRHLHQRTIGIRNAHELCLPAISMFIPEEADVRAGRLQPLTAEFAGIVTPGKGCDHRLAGADVQDLRAYFFNDADELVAYLASQARFGDAPIKPKIRTTDGGSSNTDDRIARLLNGRIGDVLESDVARTVIDRGFHLKWSLADAI
jgi:hypothetical protein